MFSKKLFLSSVFVLLFTVSSLAQMVYVTKTGKKYHKEDCRYLSKSKIQMELKYALQSGYEPCKVCKPIVKLSDSTSIKSSTTKKKVSPTKMKKYKSTTSGRCQAITKKGTQCKRKASAGSNYCWQHKR